MPRYARPHTPGALIHVISRFVNYEYRLAGPAERALFLECLAASLAGTDWRLHAYALMSSHVHLALTSGHAPPRRLVQPLLGAVARRLNQHQGRFGPLVGDRATMLLVAPTRAAELVAYLHNNPVRAGVAREAGHSDWTSHRAWVGQAPCPSWLAVDEGLSLAGYDSSAPQRSAFDRFVSERGPSPRDAQWSGRALAEARRGSRWTTGLPVELGSPRVTAAAGVGADLLYLGGVPVRGRWAGDLGRLVSAAVAQCRTTVEEVRSRSKRPQAVRARRLVLVAGAWLLRRQVNELAAALAISASSGCRLLRRGEAVLPEARRLADRLRDEPGEGAGAAVSGGNG